MALIPLDNPRQKKFIPLLQLGFRPFFLLAGLAAVLLMLLWLHTFAAADNSLLPYSGSLWHSHEMLFGYSAAVVSGFLLTAVRNWTGIQTVQNTWLAGLALVWLAARVAPLMDPPAIVTAIISIAFFPLLAFAISIPLIRSDSRNNLVFIALMLLFGVAELLFQLGLNRWLLDDASLGIQLFLHLLVILIVLMGGRVIPFFISRTTGQQQIAPSLFLERLMYASLIVWALAKLLSAPIELTALLTLIAAVFQVIRLKNWHVSTLWQTPMLWILYLGYVWLAIGLLLEAFAVFVPIPPSAAIHAYTVGVIGMVTLGMMARVSLGHTGRTIQHSKLMLVSFVLISLAPWLRVFWPLLQPQHYLTAIQLSGALWVSAFVLFVLQYLPILTRVRIDGRAG
ncbi:MAG: NnrS family protein [Chromatiales bacterium]